MNRENYTIEQLVDRWEEKREVKNLMGRFSMALLHKEEGEIFEKYWSSIADVCFGVNYGWYSGAEAVKGYYAALVAARIKSDEILKKRFPSLLKDMDEKAQGFGYLEIKSMSSDLVEIAGDGKTAKGMWTCAGQTTDMTEIGPVSFWTFGVYAVDFIKEGESWKIWHMSYLEEIKHPHGEKWWEPRKERKAFSEFVPMADVEKAVPNVPCLLREYYSTERRFKKFQPLPVPYYTFTETFSYGL